MLTIIGCGNVLRGDDGVGVVVAQRVIDRLRQFPVPGVQAFDCGTAGMEVMYRARGSHALVVIDASRVGAAPGTVHRVPGDVVRNVEPPTVNLHEFRWDHAIGMGRAIYKDAFPDDVEVLLVEGQAFELGEGLSPPVAQAAQEVYRAVLDRIAAHAAAQPAVAPGATLTTTRGTLQLPRAVFDAVFGDRIAAAVLPQPGRLVVLPLHPEDGGVIVKQRNLQGDRALELGDALRTQGWDDVGNLTLSVAIDRELGGLVLQPEAPAQEAP